MQRLGVGLVAMGWMGRLHTRGFKSLAERYPELGVKAELVMAADTTSFGRDTALTFGYEHRVADYREVMANPAVDVVSICTPNFLHREVALAAVAAGKPFWIEKPMGVSASQSRDIAEAANGAGLKTAVGFNYRHQPAIQHARELIAKAKLGRITNARVCLVANYAASAQGALSWRYTREECGAGVVGDLLSHGIDLTHYLVGRITDLTAMTETFIKERPLPLEQGVGNQAVKVSDELGPVGNEDYVAVLARTGEGVHVTLEASRITNGPKSEYIVEVYGTEGSIRWNYEVPMHLQVHLNSAPEYGYTNVMMDVVHGDFARFQPGSGNSMSFDDLKTIEAKLFVQSLLTGEQLAPSASDAWAAAEAIEAIVRSAKDGQWQRVPEVTGPITYNR